MLIFLAVELQIRQDGGLTRRGYLIELANGGWGSASYIWLSRIRNREVFWKTVNHEITHAYINVKYRNERDERGSNWSEMVAWTVSDGWIPNRYYMPEYRDYINSYIPPKLVPVPTPSWLERLYYGR